VLHKDETNETTINPMVGSGINSTRTCLLHFSFKKKPFGHDLQLPMFWFKLVKDVCLVQQIHSYGNGKYVNPWIKVMFFKFLK
jgi:hypothetical protein